MPGRSHVAGRFTGSSVGMFVNGSFTMGVTTGAQALNTTSSVVLGGTLNEDVLLDEVALYSKSMTSSEAALRWDVGSGRTPTLAGDSNAMVADAADDRAVDRVEFFVDGDYVGYDTTAPYDVSLKTKAAGEELWNGDHTLTTTAFDAEGQERQSTTQAVKVDNSGGAAGYAADYAEVSPAPAELTYDPAASTQDEAGVEIDVTNRSASTWVASDVVIRARWLAPDGTETTEPDVPLGSDLAAGQTRRVLVKVRPPVLPDGRERAQYTLRVGAYDRSDGKHFDERGCKPHDRPVIVKRAGAELGLEERFQYDGEDLGGGMQHLANLGTGNSLVRWSPLASTGRGLSTVVDLTYNSLEERSESPVGDNWSLSISGLTRFGAPLDVHPNRSDDHGHNSKRYIDLTDGDGTVHRFTGRTASDGTVFWEEPAGVHLYLRQFSTTDATRKWAVTRPDGVTFFYDAEGHPTSVEDRHGNRITYTLEPIPGGEDHGWRKKRIKAVTDASGRAYTIAYYSKTTAPKPRIRGRVRSIRDHTGSEVLFKYYDDGNLLRVSQTGGVKATGTALSSRAWYFSYTTPSGSGPAIANAADRIQPDPHTRNQSTRLFSVRDPRRSETTFGYVTSGSHRWKLASRTDRTGATTGYAYDGATRTTTLSAPLARTWRYTFDSRFQPLKIVNPKGEETAIVWTADRHVDRVTTPTSTGTATQRFAYNQNGLVTDVFNEENERTTLAYTDLKVDANDVAGKWRAGRTTPHSSRLREKVAPKGTATTAVADDYRWTFDYDSPTALGKLTRVTDPERGVTNLTPNPDGTVAQIQDPNGNSTAYAYDASGQPSRITARVSAAENRITQFGYDADGYLRWLQDPLHASEGAADDRSYRTYFDYDTWHRLGRQSAPKSTSRDRGNLIWTAVLHDANDNVTTDYGPHYGREWTKGGATTVVEYDKMDRRERVYGADKTVDPQGERWRFSYDAGGRLIQVTDPRGMSDLTSDRDGATYYAYDALDRVIRETRDEVQGATVVRSLHSHSCYDKAGDLVATVPPAANVPTADCANPGAKATRLAYDLAHRVVREQAPGKQPTTVAYDDNGNVEATTDAAGATTRISFDQRDLPVKQMQPLTGPATAPTRSITTRWQYDAGGRLIREASPRAVDVLGDKATYSQDEDHVTSFTYDGVDQLTRVKLPKGGGAGVHYVHRTYDGNGNLTSVSQPTEAVDAAPAERRTELRYFDPGWIQSADRPGRRLVLYDYTAEGWQASMTPQLPDGAGPDLNRQRLWTYYADGMVQEKRYGLSQALDQFFYDAGNNLKRALDGSGFADEADQKPVEMTVDYDSLDRVAKVRQSDSEAGPTGNWTVTAYGYDLNGNVQERIDNRRETPAGAEVTPGRRHTFDYDDADWLLRQRDFASPTATDPLRIVDSAYKPTGWPAERRITRDGRARQVTTWDYLLNGSTAAMTTRAGDGEPLALKESHSLSYLEDGDSGPFLNGNRTRDVWRRDSPKSGAPCQTQTCTTSYRYDGRDRLIKEAQRREGRDKTTEFELTASGNVAWEHRVEQDLKFHSVYEGDQLRTREVLVKNTAGEFVNTPSQRDDLRYFHSPATGNLECVTTFAGNRDTCDTASEPTVSDNLAADYAYTDDDKLRAGRTWNRAENLTGTRDDESTYDYDALDRPVLERDHHRNRWQTARLTKLSYLGTSDQVAEEQQFRIAGLQTPAAQGELNETKQYSYDPFGVRISLTNTVKGRDGAADQTRGYLYGYDEHDNVSLLLTETGAARASYGYTTLGDTDTELTGELKPDAAGPSSDPGQFSDDLDALNPYRYTGKRLDTGSGSLDMGARRYGPETGQFLQEDVYEDALSDLALSSDPLTQNRYALAAGNPITFIETDGHEPASSFTDCHTGSIYCDRSDTAAQRKRGEKIESTKTRIAQCFDVCDTPDASGEAEPTEDLENALTGGRGKVLKQRAKKAAGAGKKTWKGIKDLFGGNKPATPKPSPPPSGSGNSIVPRPGGAKRGPKPFGTGAHNAKIRDVADSVKDGQIIAGGQTGLPERLIRTRGGIRSGRRPDILVRRPDGSTYGINVGRTARSGAPIKREAEAIDDLEGAGLEMHFVPYP